MEQIILTVLTGVVTILSTILTVKSGNDKTQKQLEIHQAVTDEKIMNLTTEVHENNNLKIRVPVLEEKVQHLEDELRKVVH